MKKRLTDKEYEILTKELCARAPYEPYIQLPPPDLFGQYYETLQKLRISNVRRICISLRYSVCLPYLRPMSSITVDEMTNIENIMGDEFTFRKDSINICTENVVSIPICKMSKIIEFLYMRHLDFNDLIGQELAIGAPEEMYNN